MPRVHEMLPTSNTPTTGAWAAMDEAMQAFLSDIAANVKLLLWRQKSEDAVDEMESHKLGPDEWVALWTRFESGERRILKAVNDARRAKHDDGNPGIQQD